MANHRYPTITESLTEAIGDTPLLRLKKIGADLPANIFVKCEHLNPSGSIKDRMAIKMIEDAELSGKIKPGQHTLIDASAGNTAQALSMWAAIEGYSVKFIMSNAVGKPEKMYPLIRYGAKVELIDIDSEEADILAKGGGLQGARIEVPGNIRCRQEEEQNPNEIFWMRQGLNPSNNSAQEEIGREILTQLDGDSILP